MLLFCKTNNPFPFKCKEKSLCYENKPRKIVSKPIFKTDSYIHCFNTEIRMGKLIAAIGRLFCFVQVNQSTVGIKERFGRFEDVLDPGCHCVPWIIGSRVSGKLTLRLRQMDVRCETKTEVLFKTSLVKISIQTPHAS